METLWSPASEKGVRALLEIDGFVAHPVGQPVMLIETNPRGERQVRAHAHEHSAPARVVDIEIVLHDPALGDLEVPPVDLLSPIAVMIRAGSLALTTTTTWSGWAPLK